MCCLSSALSSNAVLVSFNLNSYGENGTTSLSALYARTSPTKRSVAGYNTALIGLFLVQQTTRPVPCQGSVFQSFVSCNQGNTTSRPWGVNPHFLPNSPLYTINAPYLLQTYFNNSAISSTLAFRASGLPYAFNPTTVHYAPNLGGYPIILDINLDQQAATNRMQFLHDAPFIHNETSGVDTYLITFNGNALCFTVTSVHMSVDGGGKLSAYYSIDALPVEMYSWHTENIERLVLECLLVLSILWNIGEEVQEVVRIKQQTGRAVLYLFDSGNLLDVLSICIQLVGIGVWAYLQRLSLEAYNIQPRYNIYATLLELPRYFAILKAPNGLLQPAWALRTLTLAIQVRYIYFAMQGINVFLMSMRLLKLLHFQPYLGIMTRSLAVAYPSLLHFMLVWLLVFLSFSLFGTLVFGASVEQFHSLWRSFETCFLILTNDNSVEYLFIYMTGWQYVAAIIWWAAFIAICVLVLLNTLIAIFVEALLASKEAEKHPTTMAEDLSELQHRAKGRLGPGKFWTYDALLKRLRDLGAVPRNAQVATPHACTVPLSVSVPKPTLLARLWRKAIPWSLSSSTVSSTCGPSGAQEPATHYEQQQQQQQQEQEQQQEKEQEQEHKLYVKIPQGGYNEGAARENYCLLGAKPLSQALRRAHDRTARAATLSQSHHRRSWSIDHLLHSLSRHEPKDPLDDEIPSLANTLLRMFGEDQGQVEVQGDSTTKKPLNALQEEVESLREETLERLRDITRGVQEVLGSRGPVG